MLRCPQCTKPLRQLSRRCPTCQADLDLLVDYVNTLQTGVERAESLTRAGELGQAVWAYLDVLEVDPDNSAARKQVGGVVNAVRQFDLATPGRRWANNLPPLPDRAPGMPQWLRWLLIGTLVVLSFCAGVLVGQIPFGLSTPATNGDDPALKQDAPPPKVDRDRETLN
jgi:hypothetical protein